MKKILLTLGMLSFLVTGCGAFERMTTGITGQLSYKCSKSGVEYVQSDSGLAVLLNKDGTPVICKEVDKQEKEFSSGYLKDLKKVRFKVNNFYVKSNSIIKEDYLKVIIYENIRQSLEKLDSRDYMNREKLALMMLNVKDKVEKEVLERYIEKNTFRYNFEFENIN